METGGLSRSTAETLLVGHARVEGMKRDELPVNCLRSERHDLPTVDCVDCGQTVRATVFNPINLSDDLDPLCPVKWVCLTPLCHGPFDR